MGLTKTEQFTDKQNEIAVLAKALGHPARIAIIEYLMSVDTCICGDIVNVLPLAQPTVSQHLKELKDGRPDQRKHRGQCNLLLHRRTSVANTAKLLCGDIDQSRKKEK
jgi:hypothetical protein